LTSIFLKPMDRCSGVCIQKEASWTKQMFFTIRPFVFPALGYLDTFQFSSVHQQQIKLQCLHIDIYSTKTNGCPYIFLQCIAYLLKHSFWGR
jgi:hypothetical protein